MNRIQAELKLLDYLIAQLDNMDLFALEVSSNDKELEALDKVKQSYRNKFNYRRLALRAKIEGGSNGG